MNVVKCIPNIRIIINNFSKILKIKKKYSLKRLSESKE